MSLSNKHKDLFVPLLKTKFYIPPLRHNIMHRQYLVERLDKGTGRKMILVCAPAGFGKTTLLIDWLNSRNLTAGWVSLDKDDNDPVRFWGHFIAAVRHAQRQSSETVPVNIDSSKSTSIRYLMSTFLNEIADISTDCFIFLDDYHFIHNQSIHEEMDYFIKYLPAHVHLIVASRVIPPFSLDRLRGRDEILEIIGTDLCLTIDEVATFLNINMGLNLSEKDTAIMHARTEGWIAGLHLLMLSMEGKGDIRGLLKKFTSSELRVMDYLSEEVLKFQNNSTRRFLMETSILKRLNGALCNAVTGRSDGPEMLRKLETENVFITPLDVNRSWYQYHNLFAEMLYKKLVTSYSELVPTLHLRACGWLEKEGYIEEAIHHALAISDYERAADLIQRIGKTTGLRGNFTSILYWVDKLPSQVVDMRPQICMMKAIASYITGRSEVAEPLIKHVKLALSKSRNATGSESSVINTTLRHYITSFDTSLALSHGNISSTVRLCKKGLKTLPETEMLARAVIMLNLGTTAWIRGDIKSAAHWWKEAGNCALAGGQLYVYMESLSRLGDVSYEQGHLLHATEIYRKAIEVGSEWGGDKPLPATSSAFVGLSQVLYERNHLDEAIENLSHGINLGKQGHSASLLKGYLLLAQLSLSSGNTRLMTSALFEATQIHPVSYTAFTSNVHMTLYASALKARLSLLQGNIYDAISWAADKDINLNFNGSPDIVDEFSFLTLTRLHIAQGKCDGILDTTSQLRDLMQRQGRVRSTIEVMILESLIMHKQHKMDRAIEKLKEAVALAKPGGYVRIFVDDGELIAKMLRIMAVHGFCKDYIGTILAAFRLPYTSNQSQLKEVAITSTISQQFSVRELQVLRLVAAGLPNKQIAAELQIANSTVKTHINNIYGKLGVFSRVQAATLASTLKLL